MLAVEARVRQEGRAVVRAQRDVEGRAVADAVVADAVRVALDVARLRVGRRFQLAMFAAGLDEEREWAIGGVD